nr:phosphoglucosamine mutase [uncultured Methanoregula sp.]
MTAVKLQKQLFGTNGVRGVTGKDITPELMIAVGQALGTMRKGHIAVGRDTRTSGESLIKSVKAGLLAMGCDVTDCGILPTPALQYLVREHFDGGVMITASHNPPEYNGVKIIEPDGTEMGDEETIKLETLIFSRSFTPAKWEDAGCEAVAPHLIREYSQAIAEHFPNLPGKEMTVVVDPGSGPACSTTPPILMKLGCRVLTINGILDGTFPGRLPEPSAEGLARLSELVISSGAAFGVAHDGDADRAVFIDETGKFVEEDQQFALIAQFICRRKPGTVVTPVSTGQVVEIVIGQEGGTVVYTPVGSIYVARTMRSLLEKGANVIFGGEGNGGLIFPDHQFCRDGGMTAAMMVSILSSTGKTLSELIGELPRRYVLKDKIRTPKGKEILERMTKTYSHEKIDLTDGVKIIRQNTWILVRASGTEPIIRIIVDAENFDTCRDFHNEIKQKILTYN